MGKQQSGRLSPTWRERFWRKVIKSGDGCWLWGGTLSAKGYGVLETGTHKHRHQVRAHRVAWELAHGEIPSGQIVCHRCDNPRCVNPTHLFLGTDVDNICDKVAKERQPRGDTHGMSKLTKAAVLIIRQRRADGALLRELAQEYDVSVKQISRVCRRETWKHV